MTAVRAHTYASDDADHGPRNGYPDDLESLPLSEDVMEVERRE